MQSISQGRRSLHFGTSFLSTLFAMAIAIAYSVFLSHCFAIACWRILVYFLFKKRHRTRRSLDFGASLLSTLYATTIIVAFSVILSHCVRNQTSLDFGTSFLLTLNAMAIAIAFSVFLSHCVRNGLLVGMERVYFKVANSWELFCKMSTICGYIRIGSLIVN